jgi:hypothetical protein
MALVMKRDAHLLSAAGETVTQLLAITRTQCHVQFVGLKSVRRGLSEWGVDLLIM